jgi:uncharacterized membrane protein YdjX (TVP38/TMEM64 family)
VRRFWTIFGAILALLLTTFLVVEAVHVAALVDPRESLHGEGAGPALLGVGLLVSDAVLPVPSSVVMLSLGALYGAPLGIALAWCGRFAMALVGFAIGRRGGPLMARYIGEREEARARDLVERRGAIAIVASRPLPLVAETVTIVAGASGMPWRRAIVASAVGSLPEAVAYGLAGGVSASFKDAAFVWGFFLLVASAFWLVERAAARRAGGGGGAGSAGGGGGAGAAGAGEAPRLR